MSTNTVSTGQLAIVFADISGSARLYQTLGSDRARAKVTEVLALMSEVIAKYGGTHVKTIGNEILCTFADAETAATATCAMHEALEEKAAAPSDDDEKANNVMIRVGMHWGPAIVESKDAFGDAVNVAARMVALAKAGQIITTRSTMSELPSLLQANARHIDHARVKGKKNSLDIFEIIWQHEDVTRMSTGVMLRGHSSKQLRLICENQETRLDENKPVVILGRSETVDVTVAEALASRQHARIERRRGKFYLIDQSTNGTYVKTAAGESFVRREEMLLSGTGGISLGRPFAENPQHVVNFTAES